MIVLVARFIKRFFVLVPGLIIAYLSILGIFPWLDAHLAKIWALLITYILAAYVLIPALIRSIRLVYPAKHLPLYCTTPDGFASDPINIGFVGTRRQVIQAMEAAGWYLADPHTPKNLVRAVMSVLLHRTYHSAPMSSLYMLGRKQDLGFQIPVEGERGHRHHVRFWATTYDASKPIAAKTIRWKATHRIERNHEMVWVGAASKDVGFQFIRHNAQITHMIHPDTNIERELIVAGIKKTKHFASVSRVTLTNKPYRLTNRVWRGYLETDGTMAVLYLKESGAKR